jgi:hypothetical protein
MKTTLIYLFKKHKRYINIDEYAEILGRMKNVNLMSLYDCCREKPDTKSTADAIIDESETQDHGMYHTFYAKQDG